MTQLTEKMYRLASTPQATKIVSAVAFAESSFFPIPPDIMLIPMVLADRARAWFLAALCSFSSVTGGILGYLIGFYLFESLGSKVIELYHLEQSFHNFQNLFQQWGFWLILGKGVTPIPYKLVTIASGATQLNFWSFLGASIISRSARFFLLSGVTWYFGEQAKDLFSKYAGLIFAVILGFLILGFVAIKWIT